MQVGEVTAKFIGKLAVALCDYGLAIHGETLHNILSARGVHAGDDGGIEHVVAAASRYWAHHNPVIQQAIASAFLGPEDA